MTAAAISREKTLKDWSRTRKIAMIVAHNPTWHDFSLDWTRPVEMFSEEKLRRPITFGDQEAIEGARKMFAGEKSRRFGNCGDTSGTRRS